ncbi:hypothetical protein ABIG05_009076 [Bradyrhizobium japonicum]
MGHADDDAAEDVDRGDDQAGDGVAADEFRGTVHRAKKGTLLFELAAPALSFLVVDQARGQIRVDRHLLARNGIQGETGADFGDTRRTLGDHDEIHRDQNREDDQTDDEVAAHDELREAGNDVARGGFPLPASRQDQTGGRNVESQPQDRRDQQHGWEGGEIERALDPQRDHQDQRRQRNRDGEAEVDQDRRNRQEQDREHGHDAAREKGVGPQSSRGRQASS